MDMHWHIEWRGVILDIRGVKQKHYGNASLTNVSVTVSVGPHALRSKQKDANTVHLVQSWLKANHPSIWQEFHNEYTPQRWRRLWWLAKWEAQHYPKEPVMRSYH